MELSLGLKGIGGTGGMSGIGGAGAAGMGGSPLGGLPGVGGAGGGGLGGIEPTQSATEAQGNAFGESLKEMVLYRPSETKSAANDLAASFAAGENVDPHRLAIQTAKAGVEIQMATRSISSAVSAVRTLFQMQV